MGAAIGSKFVEGAVAAGAVAAAVGSGAVGSVAKGVHDYFTDPTVGPGWLTGGSKVAQQQAQAEAMIRNSGVPPYWPTP